MLLVFNYPIGAEENFAGVIDIVNEVEYHYDKDKGVNFDKNPISDENKELVAEVS